MHAVLRNRGVLSVSFGHAAVDILNGALPVLLAALALQHGLSNVALGTVATVYTLAGSLTQPLFGLAVDRWGAHWLGVAGLLWLAGGYGLAAFLPGKVAFVGLVVAALGSGLYHPYGTLNARRAAGDYAASGTSLFFFFGQCGLALGPALSGVLLARLPFATTVLLLVAIALPVALVLAQFGPKGQMPTRVTSKGSDGTRLMHWTPLAVIAFALVLLFRGWPPAATNTFLPKWLADVGFSSAEYGILLSVFMFSTALGNIFGGWLADRWSHKGVVVSALAVAPFPFYVLYMAPSVGAEAIAAVTLAGFVMGMPHSVMVLMGQNLLPGRMGFASGLILGSMFAVGAAAGWITGWLGDRIGLQDALGWIPAICIAAALCALALPRARAMVVRVAAPATGD